MKKSLLAMAAGVFFSAAAANAATVYFDNTPIEYNGNTYGGWEHVYSYAWGAPDESPFTELTATDIDGHTVYARVPNAEQTQIIFLDQNRWNNNTDPQLDIKQTADLEVVDGYVYNARSQHIATITDGTWNAVEVIDPEPDPEGSGIYVRGADGWGAKPEWEFKGTGDIVTLANVSMAAGTTFKIADADWSSINYGGGFEIEPGKEYTLEYNKNDLSAKVALTDVTLYFNKITHVLTVSEEGGGEAPEYHWYAAWNIGDGTEANYGWTFGHELEEQTEGTYKIYLEIPEDTDATNYFAIFYGTKSTGWNDGARFGPANSNDDVVVTNNRTFDMQQDANKVWTIGNGNWTIVVNPTVTPKTITFELGDSTGEANVLIDRAADGDNEGIYESYGMTEDASDENTYTWSGTLEEGDKLKFNIHGVDYTYDPAVGEITSSDEDDFVTMVYELTEGDGMVAFDYEVGEVTFKVDVDEHKVYMTYKDAPDVTLTVTEGENSTIHRVYKKSEGYYQTSHTLSFTEAESVDFRVLSTRYVPDYEAGVPAKDGYRYPLVVLADEDAAPAYGGETGIEYYVTVVTGDTNYVFFTTDMETAVKEISVENGEAVYFNMQGMRIANPENGLYIVVKDGKPVKVIK